jgi:hypothetical protein
VYLVSLADFCSRLTASNSFHADGFHDYEPDNDFHWTPGDTAVPLRVLAGFTGASELFLTVVGTTQDLDDGARRVA